MRLESLKNEIPETPEFIHRMIRDEVKEQLLASETVPARTGRRKEWTGIRAAAAAVVCVLAASTAVYAGAKFYRMFLERQGAYEVEVGINPDDGPGRISLPKKIHGIDISAGYIPEGMEWIDETHLGYSEYNWAGGFSFATVLLDDDDLDKALQTKNVVESEERMFGDYGGVYLRLQDLTEDGSFNQRIYLLCPDLYRVIIIYIGDDVPREEAVKVAENLVFTQTEETIDTDVLSTWSDYVSPEPKSQAGTVTSVEEDKLPVHPVGESLVLSAPCIGKDGKNRTTDELSACVDSVRTADDLQLLEGADLPEGWAEAVGDDGKLSSHTLSYVRSGDGVDSVDEVVKTEEAAQKLVYATVTYTNHSDEEISHVYYLGSLVLMNQEGGRYQIYDPQKRPGEDCDYIIWDGAARTAEMTYSSVRDEDGKNYLPSLQPGESIQVNMAWIVNENDLDHMYLNLSDGAAYAFTDEMLERGLVDIRQ